MEEKTKKMNANKYNNLKPQDCVKGGLSRSPNKKIAARIRALAYIKSPEKRARKVYDLAMDAEASRIHLANYMDELASCDSLSNAEKIKLFEVMVKYNDSLFNKIAPHVAIQINNDAKSEYFRNFFKKNFGNVSDVEIQEELDSHDGDVIGAIIGLNKKKKVEVKNV